MFTPLTLCLRLTGVQSVDQIITVDLDGLKHRPRKLVTQDESPQVVGRNTSMTHGSRQVRESV